MRAIEATGWLEAEDIPTFKTFSARLRCYIDPLKQGNVFGFLMPEEIGGRLALGALLKANTRILTLARHLTNKQQLVSSIRSLLGP